MIKPRWCPKLFVLTICLAALVSAPASAQRGWVRDGGWVAAQVGYGWASWSCLTCGPARAQGSWTGGYSAGGTVNPHLLIGGEFNIWGLSTPVRSVGKIADHMCGLAAEVLVYPHASGPFFVKAGAGISAVGDDSAGTLGVGPAFVAGLGLDSQLSWRVSVTPVVTMYSGSLGTLRDPRSRASRAYLWNQRIVAFGLAITAQDRRPGWKKV